MKLLLNFSSTFSLLFLFVASAFAHETDVVHEEAVPTISPLLLVGLVVVFAIGGFLLWRFMLRNPNSPSSSAQPPSNPQAQQKTVSQSGEGDGSEKS